MLFQNFRSTEENAIRNLIEGSRNVYESTVVFLFSEASQFDAGSQLAMKLKRDYPFAIVHYLCGGYTSCNGNIQDREALTVTVMAGQFHCETRFLEEGTSGIKKCDIAGVLLFAFGTAEAESDLRKCDSVRTGVPVMGGAFRNPGSRGLFDGREIAHGSVALFFSGDIVFHPKALSDVIPVGNPFAIGKSERDTTYTVGNTTALRHFSSILGDSYVHQVLQGKTLEFPMLVRRNGAFAPRSITGVDFVEQSISWSGNVNEGEEAYLGMLSSDQVASSIRYGISLLTTTKHEGGFIFSDESRFALLGEKLTWNLEPRIRDGIIGIFGNGVFVPFHGNNESLAQSLALVLISDSSTTDIPEYIVRDVVERTRENPVLNGMNLLRSVLQHQLIQNASEKTELEKNFQDEQTRVKHLQNAQHEALKTIIDNAPVAIWMGDALERTVYANSRFEDLAGYRIEEILGRESYDFWSPDSIPTIQRNNEIRKKGEKSTYEAELVSKDGEKIPVRLTGVPIPNGTVAMMLDLRELRKEELQREALQRLSESKDAFLNIASHELRTPITSILGYVSMLTEGDYGALPEKALQALGVVQSSGKRLFQIINQMLQLAKLESGHMVLQEEPVALRDICQSVLREVEAVAKERGIELKYQESGNEDPPITIGDGEQLRKVILNLVGNALKFTDRGGHIMIRIDQRDDQIVLAVADNGVGIPEKDHHKIFEKF